MAALLSPSHHAVQDFLSGSSPAGDFCHGFGRTMGSQLPEGGGGAVHVAVGKSVEKAVALLQWSFNTFQGHEICILHVHRPSPLIPTLLGKLPKSQANPETVAAFINEERQEAMKLLSKYLMTCSRSRVKASVITIEADEVQKGIVDLVVRHAIKKLVIGSIPNYMKRRKMSRKASHAAKHAPSYCEMWFVNKGKLICTRQASESSSSTLLNSDGNEVETSAAGMTVSTGLLSVENMWDPLYSESASSRNRSSFSECTTSLRSTSSFSGWRGDKPNDNSNQRILAGFVADAYGLPEFSLSDLETATCNFSENFCVGKGSYGTVYKGELVGKTVAVKKLHSYNMQRQTEFYKIAQVFAKIRNPQVVDLIGVCPESLLLVYEYLPGGSLKNHLFNNNICHLSWKTRTRMVADIATGLLFLHSFEPEKIIHGNLNPSNILLNSEYRCKISDYGDHMLVASQTLRCPSFRHCTGSSCDFGYTDPEFHRTGMLTHKSDIYSFGLIILQLVTGKMLGGLVAQVRRAVSAGKVASILDLSSGDWCGYVARRLVELGLQCCGSSGRDRPEMTPSLVEELDKLNLLEEQTVPSFFLCPILKEIMHDPQVAADGFTYEGDALRGWLGNGHETSPMTNLKLSHLNLTPNYALKLAIQEWLRKS